MIVMRSFIEVVSPSSHFFGNIASRAGFSSAEAQGLPPGKPVRPGGDILDRYSIPSNVVRYDADQIQADPRPVGGCCLSSVHALQLHFRDIGYNYRQKKQVKASKYRPASWQLS